MTQWFEQWIVNCVSRRWPSPIKTWPQSIQRRTGKTTKSLASIYDRIRDIEFSFYHIFLDLAHCSTLIFTVYIPLYVYIFIVTFLLLYFPLYLWLCLNIFLNPFFLWLDSPIWAWASSLRRGFMVTHIWDTSQSVGLLWTRDQLVAETYTILTRDRHPCPRWNSNPRS
jgi:hypothetical protein